MTGLTARAKWIANYCRDYVLTLFDLGFYTLVAAAILGIAFAAAAVVVALRTPSVAPKGVAPATATPILDALKAFIQALASAPPWLALFGGGVLLLWMSGNTVPDYCRAPEPPPRAPQSAPPSAPPNESAPTP
jgi:hypothetical protein